MSGTLSAILGVLLLLRRIQGTDGGCVCENLKKFVRLSRPVIFEAAGVVGESYQRPVGASQVVEPPQVLTADSESGAASECDSEQVHLTLGDTPGSVIVSYASHVATTPSQVEYSMTDAAFTTYPDKISKSTGASETYSILSYVGNYLIHSPMGEPIVSSAEVIALQNTSLWAYDKQTGEHWANWNKISGVQFGSGQYNNPLLYYDSPFLHTVELSGLVASRRYYYRVGGSCTIYSFVMPFDHRDMSVPTSGFPMTFGIVADVGQTAVSVASLNALQALAPDVVVLAGDLSYADGWPSLWDNFGKLFEAVGSSYPVLTTGGNHEVGFGEAWVPYATRYPTPNKGSGSTNVCYWGKEVGVVHVIAICSYAGYTNTTIQYKWLQSYLANHIDRVRTPWVMVMMHTPWYNSNNGHWMEGELLRLAMEPLLYEYGVDIVYAGHVHAYERSYPVFNNQRDDCGPIHLNLGDGGNYEGAANNWRFDAPEWSAFREGSFGVASLSVVNATHALYSWHRHACGSDDPNAYNMNFSDSCVTPQDESAQRMLTSDSQWIVRPSVQMCSNRWVSTTSDNFPATPSNSNSPAGLSNLTIGLILAVCVLGVVNIFLLIVLAKNGFIGVNKNYFYRADETTQDVKDRLIVGP